LAWNQQTPSVTAAETVIVAIVAAGVPTWLAA
jgi:hypothetical protein